MNIFDQFLNLLKDKKNKDKATVVFLYGDLGAGKTTFTKNLCKHLDLNIDIQSPTFVILKKYDFEVLGFKNLVHIDAYRLNSYEDLKKIKFENYLNDINNLIFIEWPDLVKDDSLQSDINIYFEHQGLNDRKIEIR